MPKSPVGSRIDGLGVGLALADDDLMSDVVIIAKVLDIYGGVRLATAWSDGLDWITRLGMATAAEATEMPSASDVTESE